MRKTDGEYARGLARKAENDWKMAASGLEHGLPLDTVCFHIQQTAEKLLKALMVLRGIEYPFTHNLKLLLQRASPVFPWLREFESVLPDYTVFALAMRYDDSVYPTREETLAAFETVGRLRALILAVFGNE